MKYLKVDKFVEKRVRLSADLVSKVEHMASRSNVSFNHMLNLIVKDFFSKRGNSTRNKTHGEFYSVPPNLKFNIDDRIMIFENDFLTVDLRQFLGKVNLIVTSPPYNVGIDYGTHQDSMSYEDYLDFSASWLKKALELLAEDGRMCLNVPLDKNKNGAKPVYADLLKIALDVGFKYHSTIIWNEQNISRRTAWGSWMSASAPYVIAPVETIVVLYKNSWKRKTRGVSTITRDEFINWTNGVWTFPGANRKLVGHPAPFPVELPRRCIRLFSFKGDLVLDPFLGSGTTLLAALCEERRGIGVEIDPEYVRLSIERIKEYTSGQMSSSFDSTFCVEDGQGTEHCWRL